MQFLRNPKLQTYAKALFWLVVLFSVVMALLPKPPEMPSDRFGDKINHILAFSTMAGIAAVAFQRTPPWRVIERLSFIGAMIEVMQSVPALHRDCDIRDWVADTVAVLVVTGIARLVLKRAGPAE